MFMKMTNPNRWRSSNQRHGRLEQEHALVELEVIGVKTFVNNSSEKDKSLGKSIVIVERNVSEPNEGKSLDGISFPSENKKHSAPLNVSNESKSLEEELK